MPNCNPRENSFTLDDIEEPFIKIFNKCFNCSTILNSLKLQYIRENPVEGFTTQKSTPESDKKFREDVLKICKKEWPSPALKNNIEVSFNLINEPIFNDNYKTIIKTINNNNSNSHKFFKSMKEIALYMNGKTYIINNDDKKIQLIRNLQTILTKNNFSSQLIHDPFSLFLEIEPLFNKILDNSKSNHINIFLDKKPQACIEAIIEIINENLNKLNSSLKKTTSSSPKNRKLTSRRSFKKTTSSSPKKRKLTSKRSFKKTTSSSTKRIKIRTI